MKWIEPENGGSGNLINLDLIRGIAKSDLRDICFYYGNYEHWKYPGEIERDADYERIRRIALGIEGNESGTKLSFDQWMKCSDAYYSKLESNKKADPYEPDWSQIPDDRNYVATSEDGYMYAWPKYPEKLLYAGVWYLKECALFEVCKVKYNPDWRNSLRIRPGTEKENA